MIKLLTLSPAIVGCLLLSGAGQIRADESYLLRERLAEGKTYRVQVRVEVSGSLRTPAVKDRPGRNVSLQGTSQIDYEERVLTVDTRGQVSKTIRLHDRLDFKRTIAGQEQSLALRPGVRRLVILRKGHTEVPFSPDGPLSWGEIDAVRTDVFTPALLGLLPDRSVQVGDSWTASTDAVQELTDLEKIEEGQLDCKLERLTSIGGRQFARVTFTGNIRGLGEDGPVRHRLQGHLHFDLSSGYLADMVLLGTTLMIDSAGKEAGKIDGRLVLTRTPGARSSDLDEEALRKIKLEPDADNTMMLYDNPDFGVRFLHSRRWRVAQVMGSQIALATKEGNGILITVDPLASIPTAAAFLKESRDWLISQKARITRTYTPRRLRDRPSLDGFALETEMGTQKLWLDYYVTSQEMGGATIAARLIPEGLAELRREAEQVAKSVTITKRIVARPRSGK